LIELLPRVIRVDGYHEPDDQRGTEEDVVGAALLLDRDPEHHRPVARGGLTRLLADIAIELGRANHFRRGRSRNGHRHCRPVPSQSDRQTGIADCYFVDPLAIDVDAVTALLIVDLPLAAFESAQRMPPAHAAVVDLDVARLIAADEKWPRELKLAA